MADPALSLPSSILTDGEVEVVEAALRLGTPVMYHGEGDAWVVYHVAGMTVAVTDFRASRTFALLGPHAGRWVEATTVVSLLCELVGRTDGWPDFPAVPGCP